MKARAIAILAAMISVGAAAAEVIVYKQPNFAGEALTLRGAATNLGDRGFLDQVSSITVGSGEWQFCTQPDFRGECVTLGRGQYPRLEQNLNHRIESAREVTRVADRGRWTDERSGDRYAGGRGASRNGAVELFAQPDFRGRMMRIHGDTPSLNDGQFDQRASSLVIHEGNWQLCTEPGYEGVCRVLEPGEYESLGRLNRRIGSLRRIG
jgi:hypothetical protein